MADDFDLAARLASRICHDLISPVGAIGNGIELLTMGGLQPGPELSLVSDSVKNAQGRIKFFRIAFGRAEPEQTVGAAEIATTLAEYIDGGRVRIDWPAPGPVPRPELRAVFLALNCLESELAYGGVITVAGGPGGWRLTARGTRLRGQDEAWEALERDGAGALGAALVQFELLPHAVAALGRAVQVKRSDNEILMRV